MAVVLLIKIFKFLDYFPGSSMLLFPRGNVFFLQITSLKHYRKHVLLRVNFSFKSMIRVYK